MRSRQSRTRSLSRPGRGRLTVALAALGLLAAACGSGSSGPAVFTGNGNESVHASGQKLTVWIMEGTNKKADSFFNDVSTAFKQQTGASLDVQYGAYTLAPLGPGNLYHDF